MEELKKIEKKLWNQVSTDQTNPYRVNLIAMHNMLQHIWGQDASTQCIIKNYTDHGYVHSLRLMAIIKKLLSQAPKVKLSSKELYLLLGGVYLHDIGMQCDVVRFEGIKAKAVELGAKFNKPFHSREADSYSPEEQKMVRANHQYLSAAWILYARKTGETIMGNIARSIPDRLADELADICLYHSKMNILECRLVSDTNEEVRVQFIAAFLRLADELDISTNRVDMETIRLFNISSEHAVYWWMHNSVLIKYKPRNVIGINIVLNPQDNKKFGDYLMSFFFDAFREKNFPVTEVMADNGMSVVISRSKSGIIEKESEDSFPEEIARQVVLLMDEGAKKNAHKSDKPTLIQPEIISLPDCNYHFMKTDEQGVKLIAGLELKCYGKESAVPEDTLKLWHSLNPDGFILITDEYSRVIGNIDILPVKKSDPAFAKFRLGKIFEKDMGSRFIVTPDEKHKATAVYIESLILDIPGDASNPGKLRFLLANLKKLFSWICEVPKLKSICAIAATKKGKSLLENLGFVVVTGEQDRKDKHPFYEAEPRKVFGRIERLLKKYNKRLREKGIPCQVDNMDEKVKLPFRSHKKAVAQRTRRNK